MLFSSVRLEVIMEEKYRVLYKGFSGGFNLSEDMNLDEAKKFKDKCISMGYPLVYIIQIVE